MKKYLKSADPTTKYLNGHSDVIGGAIVTNSPELHDRLLFLVNAMGTIPGPFDSWLVLRGIKTLALRMKAHEQNALKIASFLETHPAIEKVIYPGNYFLENELSLLIKDAFGLCLNKISISPGTEIKTGEMKINLAINQKKIAVKIDYPITILQENKEITLENYQGEYDSNLGYLLKASSELVTILSSQKTIPLNTLSSYDLIIKVMPIGDKSIIYSLVDEQNIVDERNRVNRQPLVFNFAVGR